MAQEVENLSMELHALCFGSRLHQISGAPEMLTHQPQTVREGWLHFAIPRRGPATVHSRLTWKRDGPVGAYCCYRPAEWPPKRAHRKLLPVGERFGRHEQAKGQQHSTELEKLHQTDHELSHTNLLSYQLQRRIRTFSAGNTMARRKSTP
jgi:hypothetical protein